MRHEEVADGFRSLAQTNTLGPVVHDMAFTAAALFGVASWQSGA